MYCKKKFEANRKDKVYDTNTCRIKHWRLVNGFTRVAEWVPEAEVKKKYYVASESDCIIYLKWFRRDKERFADVYVINSCDDAIIERFKRLNVPMKTL